MNALVRQNQASGVLLMPMVLHQQQKIFGSSGCETATQLRTATKNRGTHDHMFSGSLSCTKYSNLGNLIATADSCLFQNKNRKLNSYNSKRILSSAPTKQVISQTPDAVHSGTTGSTSASASASTSDSTASAADTGQTSSGSSSGATTGSKLKLRFVTREELRPETGKKWTKVRAMREFVLSEKDLEGIPFERKRSAFLGEPDAYLYLESSLYERATEVHGSDRAWDKARRRMKLKSIAASNNLESFQSKERQKEKQGLQSGSGKVVIFAILANTTDCIFKFIGWFLTGSHSIFAECIHSLADTFNQIIVAIGIRQAAQKPDKKFPYGYANMRNITSLISGVGIFFVGTGLNCYHGISALWVAAPMEPISWAAGLLAISFLTQGTTIYKAYSELEKKAKLEGVTKLKFVLNNHDPSLNVVLLEDSASVAGVMIAGSCIALSHFLASPIPDAMGSIIIGGLLGCVATQIVRTNVSQLIGQSIPDSEKDTMIKQLQDDPMIQEVSDVKATEMGHNRIRFKAEVDFDGRAITNAYLKDQNLTELLNHVRSLRSEEELKKFLLDHGHMIIDRVGQEVDRIENELKTKNPDVRHVDLEAL